MLVSAAATAPIDSSLRNRTRLIFSSSGHLDEFLSLEMRRGPTPHVFDLDGNRSHLTKRKNITLTRIDHRFGNEGDFGRPERFSESFAIDPVQVE